MRTTFSNYIIIAAAAATVINFIPLFCRYVINYAFPLTLEDYVHRIGRTGRADRTGVAHTLFTPDDRRHAGGLVAMLQRAPQQVLGPHKQTVWRVWEAMSAIHLNGRKAAVLMIGYTRPIVLWQIK